MNKQARSTRRIAGVAAVFAVSLIAALAPLKSASADRDDWQRHRHWDNDWDNHRDWDRDRGGNNYYFYNSPSAYTAAPTYNYAPYPPQPYYGGTSSGLWIQER